MSGPKDQRVEQLEKQNAELLAALERSRASEERWRIIVSTDPECVKTVSPDGYLVEMNPAGLAMLSATTLEQVKARPLLDWIAPEHREAFKDLHRRVMQGETGELEFEVIGIDGARRWLRTQACPLRDCHGAITSVLGISRDITGQRELEAQLRHSQKMEAIGQLAGGIAHDFNNILTVILGFATTLLEDEDDPQMRRVATTQIVEAADRAAGLTRQLLAFGRRQIMKPQDVDLNDLVSNLAKMVQRLLGEDIDLQLQLSLRPLPIYADPGLIDQVLMNLVINARDAIIRRRRPRDRPRHRHRHGHPGRLAAADLRSVLHHESAGQGIGPRAGDGLRHRGAAQRTNRRVEPGWPRHHVRSDAAGDVTGADSCPPACRW